MAPPRRAPVTLVPAKSIGKSAEPATTPATTTKEAPPPRVPSPTRAPTPSFVDYNWDDLNLSDALGAMDVDKLVESSASTTTPARKDDVAAAKEAAKKITAQVNGHLAVTPATGPRAVAPEPAFTLTNAPLPIAIKRGRASQATRVVPADWYINGRRLIIPGRDFNYRVTFTALAEYMRCSDILAEGKEIAEFPVGYAQMASLISEANFGKTLTMVDWERGTAVAPTPDQRIPRTFWVRQLEGVTDEGIASRRMDDLEGKEKSKNTDEMLDEDILRREARLGRIYNVRRQENFEANKKRRRVDY
ncbi:hypothetical protein EV121DRAFT_273825 [Schizophyllum commune]